MNQINKSPANAKSRANLAFSHISKVVTTFAITVIPTQKYTDLLAGIETVRNVTCTPLPFGGRLSNAKKYQTLDESPKCACVVQSRCQQLMLNSRITTTAEYC